TEQADDPTHSLDEEPVRRGDVEALHRLSDAEVSGTGFADRLQDLAQGRHQAAAGMARLTPRTVSAPSGIPAEVVTRTSCRPLSRSSRTASPSGASDRTSGSGVRTRSAARASSCARTYCCRMSR